MHSPLLGPISPLLTSSPPSQFLAWQEPPGMESSVASAGRTGHLPDMGFRKEAGSAGRRFRPRGGERRGEVCEMRWVGMGVPLRL